MKTRLQILLLLMLAIFTGCAPIRPLDKPMSFDEAVEALAENLFQQAYNEGAMLPIIDYKFAVDPFASKETGEVIEASKDITRIFTKTALKVSPKFIVEELNVKNENTSNYLIVGKIQHETTSSGGKSGKRYRIYASIIDKSTNTVVANASIWISDARIKSSAVGIYKDSPMYILDANTDVFMKLTQAVKGTKVSSGYLQLLHEKAVLIEVDKLIDANKMQEAYSLLKPLNVGDSLKYYTALYMVARDLGKNAESEAAFGKMVDIGIAQKNMSLKFLFSVDSTEFPKNPETRKRYALWLRLIAKGIEKNNMCMKIIGHTSRTGTEQYNMTLSKDRAAAVQKIMLTDFSGIAKRTKASGRGFQDNVSGIGTDDARDAIDRRVEFAIVDCGAL